MKTLFSYICRATIIIADKQKKNATLNLFSQIIISFFLSRVKKSFRTFAFAATPLTPIYIYSCQLS